MARLSIEVLNGEIASAQRPFVEILALVVNFFKEANNSSKVVDENGEPLVVYHGANSKFNEFKPEMLGSNTEASSAKMGFFFTDKKETADWFRNNA